MSKTTWEQGWCLKCWNSNIQWDEEGELACDCEPTLEFLARFERRWPNPTFIDAPEHFSRVARRDLLPMFETGMLWVEA